MAAEDEERHRAPVGQLPEKIPVDEKLREKNEGQAESEWKSVKSCSFKVVTELFTLVDLS